MTALTAPGATQLEGWVDIHTSETGWAPQGDMPFEQYASAAADLLRLGRAFQWWLGDLLLYGEQRFPDRYDTAIDLTGYEHKTLHNIVTVCRAVDHSRRRESVSWSAHVEVAALPPLEQVRWLERADVENLTVEKLRTAIRAERKPLPDEPAGSPYIATFTVVYDALDGPAADVKAKALSAVLERNGVSVTHKQVRERHK